MSLYICNTDIDDGNHEYHSSFILVTQPEDTLPDNIDQLLTAWEFGLDVKDVEAQGDEVWSDYRFVSCGVGDKIPDNERDFVKKYLPEVNLHLVLATVEYGDDRDEVAA
jgi:hypothetical protein